MKKRVIILILFFLFLATTVIRSGLVLATNNKEIKTTEINDIPITKVMEKDNMSGSSAIKRSAIKFKSAMKAVYRSDEKVEIELNNNDQNAVNVEVTHKQKQISVETVENDNQGVTFLSINPPTQLEPGEYIVTVTDQTGAKVEQDFLWGVLAINPNKPIYQVGEEAEVAMAVLDEEGKMVCDAKLLLKITDSEGKTTTLSTTNGEIKVGSECMTHGITTEPDYWTNFTVSKSGIYNLELTATTKNGVYTINDNVEVKEKIDFEVERKSATRIFPTEKYMMQLNLKVDQDFVGKIYEEVPLSFTVNQPKVGLVGFENVESNQFSQKIEWNVSLKAGEEISLGYEYKAPEISPQFYLIGPLSMTTLTDLVFTEPRNWQVAADDLPASGVYIKTGYYIGSGYFNRITGLGFKPEMVVLKSDSNTTATIFKTNIMANGTVAFLGSASADSTAGLITLEDDGFTVVGTAATANSRYTWTAFAGSDCTSSGVFCVGAFTGNGSSPRSISTGFTPDLVWVKRSTAVAAGWKSSVMPTNVGQYFHASTQSTAGDYFTSMGTGTFGVGVSNNVSSGIYYYAAFKNVDGAIGVGTTIGIGTTAYINSVGFKPDWMFLKNANVGTSGAVANSVETLSGSSSHFVATANLTNAITGLTDNGFTLGSNGTVAGVGNTLYWATFKGSTEINTDGNFLMTTGSYTGTGNAQIIGNMVFEPDLVIIKGGSTSYGIFRTRIMTGNASGYLGATTANLAEAITSLNNNGFTVGSNGSVNTSGTTYYWTAFGNAWNPQKQSGSKDFFIGAYYGNGLDNVNVGRLPYQPDLVAIKRSGSGAPVFKTANMTGDVTSFLTASAETTNMIQSITSNGFQLGTSSNVNTAANIYYFFGFKAGVGFTLGTYAGSGAAKGINTGLQPDYLWVKGVGGTRAVSKTPEMATNGVLPFVNAATISNAVTGTGTTGFTLGTAGETNKSGLNYRYAAWQEGIGSTTATPAPQAYNVKTGYYIGSGYFNRITGLGFKPEMVVLKSDSNTTATIFKTNIMANGTVAFLGSASADSTAGLITLEDDGFTVVGTAATANSRYTWTAFAGSDCTSSGVFCVGAFTGNGSSPRSISTGFTPDLVWVKRSTAVAAGWKSSVMPTNVGQYFHASTQSTAGDYFTSMGTGTFGVGVSNNVSSGIYYYAAFKNVDGAIGVGTTIGIGTTAYINSVGFKPDWMFLKNANVGTSGAVANSVETLSGSSSHFVATANLTNAITGLTDNGFTLGSNGTVAGVGNTLYWATFKGSTEINTDGNFLMTTGSYTGTGNAQIIGNMVFEPDLVIIKGGSTSYGIFRTRIMTGNASGYLGATTANLAEAITSLNNNGFTVGSNGSVNTSGTTYYWTAFGNAWNPQKQSGSKDFFIGAYYGNGLDNVNVGRLPYQPDLVAIKRSGSGAPVFKTANMTGDVTSFLTASAETTNMIQSITSNGFQLGTSSNVNTAANIYYFFGFKAGVGFTLGTYAGSGAAKGINTGLQPDYLWVKGVGGTRAVSKTPEMATNGVLPFVNAATISNAVTGTGTTGFTLGTAGETNKSGLNYRYAAWKARTTSNNAPEIPSLLLPDNGGIGQLLEPTYKTVSTDADGDNLQYRIQICTDSGMTAGCQIVDQTSSQIGWSGQNVSGLYYSVGTTAVYTVLSSNPLIQSTTYFWKSWAIDPNGSGTWSGTQATPFSFTTLRTGPSANQLMRHGAWFSSGSKQSYTF